MLNKETDLAMRKTIAQQAQPTPTETDAMKMYFIDIRGQLHEYTKVEHVKGIAPADGCDILIRDVTGYINSAKSSHYFASIAEAVADFEARQLRYIERSEQTLAAERAALASALSIPNKAST